MDTNTSSNSTLGYQYCSSSYSSTYSISCSSCCCYSDSYYYYPYCCSCPSDFVAIYIIVFASFISLAIAVVILIQYFRKKRQTTMQLPFLPNNTSNQVIYVPPNQPQNNIQNNAYQPPNNQTYAGNPQANQYTGIDQPYVAQTQRPYGNNPQINSSSDGQIERHYRYQQENKQPSSERL